MKLSMNTDFTTLPRAGRVIRAAEISAQADEAPFDFALLDHEERHLRRRVITLSQGSKVMVDLLEPVHLDDGDVLVLDDGRRVGVVAAEEEVFDIVARDAVHLTELAWHIGNRHLAAQIEPDRIRILRDHVIQAMLEGLGARVSEVTAPFRPVHGAYAGHGHHHGHGAGHGQDERDRFGRLPGDPHYGHNHG